MVDNDKSNFLDLVNLAITEMTLLPEDSEPEDAKNLVECLCMRSKLLNLKETSDKYSKISKWKSEHRYANEDLSSQITKIRRVMKDAQDNNSTNLVNILSSIGEVDDD